MPEEVSPAALKRKAYPLVKLHSTGIVGVSIDLDSVEGSMSEAPIQTPLDRLRAVPLTLVLSEDIDTELRSSKMDDVAI